MTNQPLKQALGKHLHDLHDHGVGSRTIALTVTEALFDFLCNEAGAFTPQAVGDVIDRLQALLREAEEKMTA